MGYSRFMTLPLLWLENAGLNVNDSVDLEIGANGELILTAHKEGQP